MGSSIIPTDQVHFEVTWITELLLIAGQGHYVEHFLLCLGTCM